MLRIFLHEGLNRDQKTQQLNKIYKEVKEFEKLFNLTSCGLAKELALESEPGNDKSESDLR